VGSNGSAIEAHHKQLALHVTLSANTLSHSCMMMAKQPTMVLQHGYYVSRRFGHIARSVDGTGERVRSSPIEVIPNRIQLLGFGRHDCCACRKWPGSELSLRWALRLERDSRRLVNGGKMGLGCNGRIHTSGGRWPAPLSPTLLVFPVVGLVIPLPFAIKDTYLDTTSDATAMGPGLRPFAAQTPPDHGCVTSPLTST
jgi:hypothetical protein